MEYILAAMNPATGTDLPIPLFIISGVIVVGCVAAAIITKQMKNKKSKKKNRRK